MRQAIVFFILAAIVLVQFSGCAESSGPRFPKPENPGVSQGTPTPSPAEITSAEEQAKLTEARTLSDSGDFLGAENLLKEAVAEAPGDKFAHMSLGYAYLKEKKGDLAASEFSEALRLDPHLKFAHEALGWAYLLSKNFAKAEEAFGIEIRENPDATGYEGIGYSLEGENQPKQAVAAFEEALKHSPSESDRQQIAREIEKLTGKSK